MASTMHPETKQAIELVVLALEENPQIALGPRDIAKKIGGKTRGRNLAITKALKWLKKNKKIVQFSAGNKGPGSTYMLNRKIESTPEILTKQERAKITVQEAAEAMPLTRPQPVCTIEISKATLKVLVKAVMANCQPMEPTLQRATLQCMEKLI